MGKRQTKEELQEKEKRQQERLKQTRKQLKQATMAEEAKLRKEIVDAVKEWWEAAPEDKRPKFEDLPEYFRGRAEKRRKSCATSTDTSAAVIDRTMED